MTKKGNNKKESGHCQDLKSNGSKPFISKDPPKPMVTLPCNYKVLFLCFTSKDVLNNDLQRCSYFHPWNHGMLLYAQKIDLVDIIIFRRKGYHKRGASRVITGEMRCKGIKRKGMLQSWHWWWSREPQQQTSISPRRWETGAMQFLLSPKVDCPAGRDNLDLWENKSPLW